MEHNRGYLINKIFESDNRAGFINRDRVLGELVREFNGYTAPDRDSLILAELMRRISTPTDPADIFVGRMEEGLPEPGVNSPDGTLWSYGHMSYRWHDILTKGVRGIIGEVEENSARLDDADSLEYAHNMRIVADALHMFARRWAKAARAAGNTLAAEALEIAPWEPAPNLFAALQGMWLIHLVSSCLVGSRDYAFGRFDAYMQPFVEQALANGMTEDEIAELFADFFLKCNEIAGTASNNHFPKPVHCQASKQYVIIGGAHPNLTSRLVLRAAVKLNIVQPVITTLLSPDADPGFTCEVFAAVEQLGGKTHVYNYDLAKKSLLARGVPPELAEDYTYSACCTMDFHWRNIRDEWYMDTVGWLCDTLGITGGEVPDFTSADELVTAYRARCEANIEREMKNSVAGFKSAQNRSRNVFDALFIGNCTERCRYPGDGGVDYRLMNLFVTGTATLGDSLCAIDRLVFVEKRFTLRQYIEIVKSDFAGHEELRAELSAGAHFGNDGDADEYAVKMANAVIDAADTVQKHDFIPAGIYLVPGIYSLEHHNHMGARLPATPDGRCAGTPVSENQSPVYGCDLAGPTALLRSVAKLPFERTGGGGLNFTFTQKLDAETLEGLTRAYFAMGGMHIGTSFADRATLLDAQRHPEDYRTLTVRLYGFSDYFTVLPPWQQSELINRTFE